MQTFLPYRNVTTSVRTLDNRRLNKQTVECLQIYQVLTRLQSGEHQPGAWAQHPAVRMWQYHIDHHTIYARIACVEAIRRGINAHKVLDQLPQVPSYPLGPVPFWLGNTHFHQSHRLNLAFKEQDYARRFRVPTPAEKPPYVWPMFANEYTLTWNNTGMYCCVLNRYTKPRVIYTTHFTPRTRILKTRQRNGVAVHYLLEPQPKDHHGTSDEVHEVTS